jgi:hypothetical protein
MVVIVMPAILADVALPFEAWARAPTTAAKTADVFAINLGAIRPSQRFV